MLKHLEHDLTKPIPNSRGCNYESHQVHVENHVWRFLPRLLPRVILFVFILFGTLMVAVFPLLVVWYEYRNIAGFFGVGTLWYVLAVSGYTWVARFLWRIFNEGCVFDGNAKEFYFLNRKDKQHYPFSDIDHLQLISYSQSMDGGGTYTTYQLNVVLKSRQRYYIVDHAQGDFLKYQGQELANYLGVEFTYHHWRH